MRNVMRLVAAVGCCLPLAAGCMGNIQIGTPSGMPGCTSPDGRVADSEILVAQSVPSAQLLPCLRSLPVGWSFRRLEVQSGRTQVQIGSSDLDGDHRVTVALEAGCDVAGAPELASDLPGARRYDRVAAADTGYLADRYYVFQGGCISYHFDLHGRAGADAGAAVAAGLGSISRSSVAAAVRDRSHGRLTLDPGGQP
jgi:hypothetical protein